MTAMAESRPPTIDTETIGFARGGYILLKQALSAVAPGDSVEVRGRDPDLPVHLRAWCRAEGHQLVRCVVDGGTVVAEVRRGLAETQRWAGAEVAGAADPHAPGAIDAHPPGRWGVAARGARVERGGPEFHFSLDARDETWTDDAPRLYAQAAAAQWDPATAVDWNAEFELEPAVEAAVVEVMTYLVENENAALLVPARFLGQLHPHFREVMQVLAVQVADEARHVEVFTRRALLRGGTMGRSSAGGQASLKTLFDEPDFALASFLLSVLGEGTFLSLLSFLQNYAPDPVTRQVTRLAYADEARHVAFGMAHLEHQMRHDPDLRPRLATAVQQRHDALAQTAGLNGEVFDALVVLAAGGFTAEAVATGWDRVQKLQDDMDQGRRRRLVTLGFTPTEAVELSSLHTRNFM